MPPSCCGAELLLVRAVEGRRVVWAQREPEGRGVIRSPAHPRPAVEPHTTKRHRLLFSWVMGTPTWAPSSTACVSPTPETRPALTAPRPQLRPGL